MRLLNREKRYYDCATNVILNLVQNPSHPNPFPTRRGREWERVNNIMKIATSVFIITLVLFSLFTYAFVDANISYLKILYTGYYSTHRTLLASFYTVLIAVLFGCFYFFTKNTDRFKHSLKKITTFVILATIIAYPAALTFDIFNYMTTAKVVFFYQENPYIIYPIEFINDSYLEFTRAANKTALYGPFWILLSGIPHLAGLGNFALTLFSFKIFIALFYVATVYLINKLDRNAVIFFALNPLVIIETLVSSHNDIVMIFFALLSFYLFYKKRYGFSALAIAGSILIKFATLFLFPVFAAMIKDRIIGKKINREKAYLYSALFIFLIFVLSPFREELYPWYSIWLIAFTAFLYKNKFLQNLVLVFSFGLMLRYVPYMATGSYFGSAPILRNLLMVAPIVIFLIYSRLRMLKKQ